MVIARIAGITAAVAATGLIAYAVKEFVHDEREDAHSPVDIAAESIRRYAGSDGVVSLPSEARTQRGDPYNDGALIIRSREALFTAADSFGAESRAGFNDSSVTFDEVRLFAASFDEDHKRGLNGDEWVAFNTQYREWSNVERD